MSEEEKVKILGKLVIALHKLKEIDDFSVLMPEVRINLAYSLPNPKNSSDVAAIPGRITSINNKVFIPNMPKFGTSDHMARNIIEFTKYNEEIRAGINFKYTIEMVNWLKDYCRKEKLLFNL